jgi:hypothetical protein
MVKKNANARGTVCGTYRGSAEDEDDETKVGLRTSARVSEPRAIE